MLKAIAYISTAVLMTTIVLNNSKSQIVLAESTASSASSVSTTTTGTGQPVTVQQTFATATVDGKTVTETTKSTTILDASGKPITTVTQTSSPTNPVVAPAIVPAAIQPPIALP